MARPTRFERVTAWFVARYSIQLSYGRFDCCGPTGVCSRDGELYGHWLFFSSITGGLYGGERGIIRPTGLTPAGPSLRSVLRSYRCSSNPALYISRVRTPLFLIIWRRERDSNPRWAFNPYSLSRGAPSAARPSLQIVTFTKCGHHTKLA